MIPPLLDPRKEIRLLRILPGDFPSAIQCNLESYELESAPHFHAISYTWGEKYPQREITIDKRSFIVRQNCHFALRQARLHVPGELVWIDSVCIDQENNSEKGHQVAIMGGIYARALKVLACIGDSDESFEEVLRRIINCPNAPEHLDTTRESLRERFSCWVRLSRRPYFSRLWIVQELKGGEGRTSVLCGTSCIAWDCLAKASHNIPVGWRGQIGQLDRCISPGKPLSLDDVLKDLCQFKCADPRDRIYGTLRLVDWKKHGFPEPTPNYTISRWDLALQLLADGHAQDDSTMRTLIRALEISGSELRIRRNNLIAGQQVR